MDFKIKKKKSILGGDRNWVEWLYRHWWPGAPLATKEGLGFRGWNWWLGSGALHMQGECNSGDCGGLSIGPGSRPWSLQPARGLCSGSLLLSRTPLPPSRAYTNKSWNIPFYIQGKLIVRPKNKQINKITVI